MKILVVGNYFYPEHTGGVEIVSHNLVKHYRLLGHEVYWLAADVSPVFRRVGDGDIPIRSWNYTEEKLGFPSPLPRVGDLYKIISGVQWCEVVHLQDCLYPINIIVFGISKLLGKPVLITQYAKFIPYRKFYKRFLQFFAYHTIGRLMFRLADRVVFITKNVLDSMRVIDPRRLKDVVPLGVDTEFFSPLPLKERRAIRGQITLGQAKPIILFVGRMVERKGIHLLQPLVAKHKEWHWVFVGRPDDYDPGEWGFPNLQYYQNVTEEQLKNLYAASDLLVHPSVGEGITLAVAESLASGTPVVISQESLYEVDENDRKVFLVVQPDTNAIDRALIDAFSNPEQLMERRNICRLYAVKRLSWGKMTDSYLNILEAIV